MRLASKLLGFLNRAFDKDPQGYLALRLQYDGGMQWQVLDGVLTTTVQGGTGRNLQVALDGLTVRELAGYLSLQRGYSTPYVAGAAESGASALRLLDAGGDIRTSNGDHLFAYTAPLYFWLDACAAELALAQTAIQAIPDEMATVSASGEWLDYQGKQYSVPRILGELDGLYARRIIAEVLRPKGNNLAIAQAIADYTGEQTTITDVVIYRAPEPGFDGIPHFDGAYNFQPAGVPVYGLFDCTVGYDLLGAPDTASYVAVLRAIINRLRDAGTQLRQIVLSGSTLADTAFLPTDDTDTLIITHTNRFDGTFRFDGSRTFGGDGQDVGTIEGDLVPTIVQTRWLQVMKGGSPVDVLVPASGDRQLRVFLPPKATPS